jgi:hypothetical protein
MADRFFLDREYSIAAAKENSVTWPVPPCRYQLIRLQNDFVLSQIFALELFDFQK